MPFRIAEIAGLKALSTFGGLACAAWLVCVSSESRRCCICLISSRSLEVSDSCARTGTVAAASAAAQIMRNMGSPLKKRLAPPQQRMSYVTSGDAGRAARGGRKAGAVGRRRMRGGKMKRRDLGEQRNRRVAVERAEHCAERCVLAAELRVLAGFLRFA